jgi:hypothetical protein
MQESILATAMVFQKFDLKFVDPEYKLTVKQTLTLKARDLFMYAKLRPGIDVLTLQRDIVVIRCKWQKTTYRGGRYRSYGIDIHRMSSDGTEPATLSQLYCPIQSS